MMLKTLALPALALLLASTTANGAPLPPQGYGQDRGGWDTAPRELNDIQRQGFRDGIEGARKDIDNRRRPDVNNRDEYRHPRLPREQREAYREGFRRGYEMAISRLTREPERQFQPVPPPPPMREPERRWDMGLAQMDDLQRRGFLDGMVGARRDMDNRRRPDVNNRDEYRDPHLPPGPREQYQEAFRRGYDLAMSQLLDQPGQGLGRFGGIEVRGFMDGLDGARKDVDNHRRPDVNNRDEYRNPNVPFELREEYQEAFRRGYERQMSELMGGAYRR